MENGNWGKKWHTKWSPKKILSWIVKKKKRRKELFHYIYN